MCTDSIIIILIAIKELCGGGCWSGRARRRRDRLGCGRGPQGGGGCDGGGECHRCSRAALSIL